jgi:hypothetical protein
MNFSHILPFVMTIGYVAGAAAITNNDMDVGAEPPRQQLLRKVLEDTPAAQHSGARHLQIFQNLFDPCPIIASQFPSGQVSCNCNVALTSGKIDYSCSWSDSVCVGATNTLGFCGTPVYSGTLNLFQLNVVNKICIQNINAIGNLVSFNEFCVNLTVNPRNDKVVSCTANLGDTICNRCVPCSGGGLNLDCQNAAAGAISNNSTCTAPLRTVTGLTKSKKATITKPFVPNFHF